MTPQYKKEEEALRLLHRNWDQKTTDDRRAIHHSFLWTMQAASDVGLISFNTPVGEETDV